MEISGFTIGHNLIESGYPIIEAIDAVGDFAGEIVFVDMASTDTTRQVAERLGCTIIDSDWHIKDAHLKAFELMAGFCRYDTIIMFEADEVFDWELLHRVWIELHQGHKKLCVNRIQVEQNFQRCRWYPHPVYRIFPRGDMHYASGPTVPPAGIKLVDSPHYLWDCTNNFRDDWLTRLRNQAEIFPPRDKILAAPQHILAPAELTEQEFEAIKELPYWELVNSPFVLPESLKRLVGVTSYQESEGYKRVMG